METPLLSGPKVCMGMHTFYGGKALLFRKSLELQWQRNVSNVENSNKVI